MKPKKVRKRQSNYAFARKLVRRLKGKMVGKKLGDFQKKEIHSAIVRREVRKAILESGLKDRKAIADLMALSKERFHLPPGAIPVTPETIPTLVAALNHPEKFIRNRIINALSEANHRPSIPLYLEKLEKGSTAQRSDLGFVLYALHNKKAIPELLPLLRRLLDKDPSPEVRRYSARVLGWTKDPEAFPILVRHLNDPALRARDVVLSALFNYKDTKFKGQLIKLFEGVAGKDPSERMRTHAVSAISNLGLPGVLDSLIKLTGHDYPQDTIQRAFNGLSKFKDERVVNHLCERLSLSYPNEVRAEIVKSLGEIGDRKSVPAMIKALEGSGSLFWEPVGKAAVEALYQFRDEKRVIDAFLKVYRLKENDVEFTVTDALRKMTPELVKGDKVAQQKLEVVRHRMWSGVSRGAADITLFCLAYDKKHLRHIPLSEKAATREQIEYLNNLIEGIRHTRSYAEIPEAFGILEKEGKK